MNEAITTILVLWAIISIIWLLLLHSNINDRRRAFREYVEHHQHFIALYVEVAKQNRELIKELNNFRGAVTSSFFYEKEYTLSQMSGWYKKHKLSQRIISGASSEEEVEHFKKIDEDETRFTKHTLS